MTAKVKKALIYLHFPSCLPFSIFLLKQKSLREGFCIALSIGLTVSPKGKSVTPTDFNGRTVIQMQNDFENPTLRDFSLDIRSVTLSPPSFLP